MVSYFWLKRTQLQTKPSDLLPTPLDGKPKVKLTELARREAGLGWETITYEGEDGHRYEVSVNIDGVNEIGYSSRRWKMMSSVRDR